MPAPWTDSKITEKTVAILKEIGQSPVVMKKEVNGFLLNRLQYAVIMEAWRLVEVKYTKLANMDLESSNSPPSPLFRKYCICDINNVDCQLCRLLQVHQIPNQQNGIFCFVLFDYFCRMVFVPQKTLKPL